MGRSLRESLRERVLLLDGGLGTWLRARAPQAPCCEILNERDPELVDAAHEAWLAAGADVITTNSFCGDAPSLAAHGLAERSDELCHEAARLARAAADRHARDARPRFVLGAIGPGPRDVPDGRTTRLQVARQAAALVEGGADGILLETCRDAGRTRAALEALAGGDACLVVSFTPLDDDLPGALVGELEALGVTLAGVNCVEGPRALAAPLAELARRTRLPLGAWPNAGRPRTIEGRGAWPVDAADFAEGLAAARAEHDLRLVGGCCGTSPEHVAALAERLARR